MKQGGFTLIEVAIIVLLVGLLIIPVLRTIALEARWARVEQVRDFDLGAIEDALQRYAVLFGRYPRPANFNVGPAAANYGREVALAGLINCVPPDTATACLATDDANVIIGALPYRTLGLPDRFATDPFGSKWLYAVSVPLSDGVTAFDNTNGEVDFFDLDAGGAQVVNASGHYVVVSFGENQAGGFSDAGFNISPCPLANLQEAQACDRDNVFWEEEAPGGPQRNLNTASPNYFDDFVTIVESRFDLPWELNTAANDLYNINDGVVMIGNGPALTPPLNTSVATVDVIGNAHADRVLVNRVCDYSADRANQTVNCPGRGENPNLTSNTTHQGSGSGSSKQTSFSPAAWGMEPTEADRDKAGGGIYCGDNGALQGIVGGDEVCLSKAAGGALINEPYLRAVDDNNDYKACNANQNPIGIRKFTESGTTRWELICGSR